ncbi:RNA-directed DNA polymerase, eukaryota, reverse transcriptase zinc-binding domain protein, partial [Tanacetum coccineum]
MRNVTRFVYAHVRASGRKVLWKELMCHSLVVKDEPWLLMGDFNVILDPSERSAGSSYFTSSMEDFRDCLGEIGVEDVAFMEKFVNSYALFLPFVASDHAPAVIEIPVISGAKTRPFKFANFLADKGEFLPIVKKPLRKLKFAQGDLAKKVLDSRHELERVQAMIVNDSFNLVLREKETECFRAYKDAMRDEKSMLKQRAKVSWLSKGDANTEYFHNTVKGNLNRNRMESVEDLEGKRFSGQHVGTQFVKHFQSVLGEAKLVDPISDHCSLFVKRLFLEDVEFMVRPVSKDEIKSVFFAMNDEKAPGPDGFLSNFFKAHWSIIRDEVCTAISDFFKNGRLLKEVNATIIALVPKSKSPQKVSDFRPIACCNVIYKAITKIIDNRIKGCLGACEELSQKSWHRGFETRVTPLIPDIKFTLVVEVFSLMVKRKIEDDGNFKYHWRCDKLKITYLSFVDNLMVFSSADLHSVKILCKALSEFSGVSGLVPNLGKSFVFFGNVPKNLKSSILQLMPLSVGILLVKYLGLPLITS